MRPEALNPLFADVTALPKVGPKLALLISRAAGPRVVDVLFQPPAGLIDRSARPKLADAPFGQLATVEVTVDRHDPPRIKRLPYRIICSDETGFLTLIFFHARPDYLKQALPEGAKRIVSGRIEEYGGARQMTHPDHIVDPVDADALPMIEPVYPLTAGLTNAVMRRAADAALGRAPLLPEWQDPAWLKKQQWPGWREALATLHKPQGAGGLSLSDPARQRLAYDELLANQLALLLIRRARTKSVGRTVKGDGQLRTRALKALPFALTGDQKNALKEIFADMEAPERMVRLVQGDVGSG
ncbi:MAG: ATP-dependent DNA helicase RecG, partial [Amphiplicatus sp.]